MKVAIVTGSKGFIGKNLVKKLEELHNYIIVEINEDIFTENWKCDLLDILESNKADVIFHLGACSNTLEQDVNYMMKLNFEFTKVLVDWSKNNNCKMIYSSSAANYGQNGDYPANLYGWSKYVAEQYVISNNGIALRYFNVYGPGEEHKGKMASLAYQSFKKDKLGENCYLFPNRPTRDFVYVSDVVSANLYAQKKYTKLNKKTYDVGSGESKSFEEVLNYLNIKFDYLDESSIPEGYQFYTCSDKEKFMEGWKPEFDLKRGVEDYKIYLEFSIKK